MWRTWIVTASLLAGAALAGSQSGPTLAATSIAAGSASAAQLVDTELDVEGTECRHEAMLDGPSASPRRFCCQLPQDEGEVQIRLAPNRDHFALIGRSVHQTVASESKAEAHTAALLNSWIGVSHVVCGGRGGRTYQCDADFEEQEFFAGVELTFSYWRNGLYGVGECRLTRLGRESQAVFACQHLTLTIDMEETTLQGLEETSSSRSHPRMWSATQ
jgi:hypothetical protein